MINFQILMKGIAVITVIHIGIYVGLKGVSGGRNEKIQKSLEEDND